jgi:CRP/FNR family transcriptional regulator
MRDLPAIRAFEAWLSQSDHGQRMKQLLGESERRTLGKLSTPVRYQKGENIYTAGEPAAFVFIVAAGSVKTFRQHLNGEEHITAFLFGDDVFGLTECGKYENSATAIAPVVLHRIPLPELLSSLRNDAALEFQVIVKLCHELREAQRHAALLSSKGTSARLLSFLKSTKRLQADRGVGAGEIYLPMTRTDIADYIGVSLAALSRSFHALSAQGILRVRDRHHVYVLDQGSPDACSSER